MKQSRKLGYGLLRRFTPRNDEGGMDCFKALPLAMTKEVRAFRNDEEKGSSQ